MVFIHAPSTAMVAQTPAGLIRRHGGRCLLRPVRADQSELVGFFDMGALKRLELSDRGRIEALQQWTV